MKLFRRIEPPKSMPEHHRTALRHVASFQAALRSGDEKLAKSHLGHALRAFSSAGQQSPIPTDRQPMPSEGMEP